MGNRLKKPETPQDEYDRAWNYGLFFLKFRPRSVKEMGDRLTRKEFSAETVRAVLERLQSLKFLDDRQFARGVAQGRFREGRGAYYIQRELFKKGIAKDLAQETLRDVESELPSAEERAWEMLERKAKNLGDLTREAAYRRLGGYLARRGFGLDTVKDVLNRYFKSQHQAPQHES